MKTKEKKQTKVKKKKKRLPKISLGNEAAVK